MIILASLMSMAAPAAAEPAGEYKKALECSVSVPMVLESKRAPAAAVKAAAARFREIAVRLGAPQRDLSAVSRDRDNYLSTVSNQMAFLGQNQVLSDFAMNMDGCRKLLTPPLSLAARLFADP